MNGVDKSVEIGGIKNLHTKVEENCTNIAPTQSPHLPFLF